MLILHESHGPHSVPDSFFPSRKLAVHELTWITVVFVDFTLTALVTHGAHTRVGALCVDALPSIPAGGTLGTLVDVHVAQSACQQTEYVLLLSLPAHSTKTLNGYLGGCFFPLVTQYAATDRQKHPQRGKGGQTYPQRDRQ